MANTYSTNLALELIGNNDQAGTWGNTTNNNLGVLIEQSISGYVTQAITDGADTVITIPNGVSGVARNMSIEMTGSLSATRNLIVPANRKLYFIFNNTTGSQAVVVKVSGQTGVSVPNGQKMILVCNGTDVVNAVSYAATMSVGSLTLSGGTANGVAYLNASKQVATGSALVFDGTNLGVGTASPATRLDVTGAFGTSTTAVSIFNNTAASASNIARLDFRLVNTFGGNERAAAIWGLNPNAAGNNGGALVFGVSANGTATTPSEVARFDQAGNLGVGTASPARRLHLKQDGTTAFCLAYFENANSLAQPSIGSAGNAVAATNLRNNMMVWNQANNSDMVFGTANQEVMRLDSSGNLGVGTASPAARLQVKSSVAQAVNIEGTTARGSGNIFAAFLDPTGRKGYMGYGASDDTFFVANELSADVLFQTNGLNRMRITSGGNIVAGASAALATTATDGFLYVPSCAGVPTGTPTAVTGMVPIVVDTTNNRWYFYSGGAWRDAGP